MFQTNKKEQKMWATVNKKMNNFFEADFTVEETKRFVLTWLFIGIFGLLLATSLPMGWWWGPKHWISIR